MKQLKQDCNKKIEPLGRIQSQVGTVATVGRTPNWNVPERRMDGCHLARGRSGRPSHTVAILNSPRSLGRVWGIVGGDEAFTPWNEDGRWKAGSRMDAVRKTRARYIPNSRGPSYKDTPYSVPRINVVRERRGPRRHLSLLELIKAESAARWSSGITLSSPSIPPALNPPPLPLSLSLSLSLSLFVSCYSLLASFRFEVYPFFFVHTIEKLLAV